MTVILRSGLLFNKTVCYTPTTPDLSVQKIKNKKNNYYLPKQDIYHTNDQLIPLTKICSIKKHN